MEPEIIFVPAAFKHHVTEADIRHAYKTKVFDRLMEEEMMTYTDMTDEEYDALDEEMTRNPPTFGPPGSGWLTQRELCQHRFTV
jgi:hypothetical protein